MVRKTDFCGSGSGTLETADGCVVAGGLAINAANRRVLLMLRPLVGLLLWFKFCAVKASCKDG